MTWARVTSLYFGVQEGAYKEPASTKQGRKVLRKVRLFPQRSRQDVKSHNSSIIDQFS